MSPSKAMSLLFNVLSSLVITFLPRSKHLFISWLQSPSAVILEPPKIKSVTVSIVLPSICHEVMGLDDMILVFWMLSFKPNFSLSTFTFLKRFLSKDFIDFEWPRPVELDTVIKDYIEEEVDEKYYITNEKADKLIEQLIESGTLPNTEHRTQNTEHRTQNTEFCERLTSLSSPRKKGILQTASVQESIVESQTCNQHLQWFWSPKNKVWHCFHCFPIYFPWSDGTGCHDLSFLNVEL